MSSGALRFVRIGVRGRRIPQAELQRFLADNLST